MLDEEISAWIAALRHRLAAGELAALGPIDVGDDTDNLPGEVVVRIMLADLNDLDSLAPGGHDQAVAITRRRALSEDLQRLRELIG
jgi:hypothetical protein